MAVYFEKAKGLMKIIQTASIEVILQSKNTNAYAYAKLASTRDAELVDTVLVEFLAEPSIRQLSKIVTSPDPTSVRVNNRAVTQRDPEVSLSEKVKNVKLFKSQNTQRKLHFIYIYIEYGIYGYISHT